MSVETSEHDGFFVCWLLLQANRLACILSHFSQRLHVANVSALIRFYRCQKLNEHITFTRRSLPSHEITNNFLIRVRGTLTVFAKQERELTILSFEGKADIVFNVFLSDEMSPTEN